MVKTLKQRRQKVLEHIGRYRLTLRDVISKVFLDGKDPSNLLRQMVDEGLVISHNRRSGKGLDGGLSYYQLTREGARQAGVPSSRAKSLDNRVPQYLAFLAFCCLGDKRREMMEPEQFTQCFPGCGDVSKEFYAVEKSPNGPLFYRLIFVGSANAPHYIKRLSEAIEKAESIPELSLLLSKGFFLPTLVVGEEGQVEQFKELTKKSSLTPKRHRRNIRFHTMSPKPS